MMDYEQLEDWLLEHGGPAIQLRMYAGQTDVKSKVIVENAVSKLLDIDEVNVILDYMDGFNTPLRDNKSLEHLIHYYKDTCIENFFPILLSLGFRAGIPLFDKKMQPIRDVFRYLHTTDHDFSNIYKLMLHKFFFMAGYAYQEVVESMEQRLDAIHNVANEHIFDIYQDESKLPKAPAQWAGIGILKDDLNPFSRFAKMPLPTIYDIFALAHFPVTDNSLENQMKISNIIEYILDPKFQEIREGYGLLWVASRRTYHACGWSPTLPKYENNMQPQIYPLLYYLDTMSNFKEAYKSQWFLNFISYFEQFKTERGTYIFPKEFFCKKLIEKAFLNESNMSLRPSERKIRKLELASTIVMYEVNKRITQLTK
ncbi:MAG: hypothetical protein K0R00_286 [Herbinix sp.]|jgi:hypothetical protein|nr:hypothetical protein [Herbinix sp.]